MINRPTAPPRYGRSRSVPTGNASLPVAPTKWSGCGNANTGQPLGPPLSGQTHCGQRRIQPRWRCHRAAGADKTVRLWNADTAEPIGQPLTGQSGSVLSVAFSPDGQRIASASTDKTVWIWDQVQSGGPPVGHPLVGHYDSGRPVVGHTAAVMTVGLQHRQKPCLGKRRRHDPVVVCGLRILDTATGDSAGGQRASRRFPPGKA